MEQEFEAGVPISQSPFCWVVAFWERQAVKMTTVVHAARGNVKRQHVPCTFHLPSHRRLAGTGSVFEDDAYKLVSITS